MCEKNASKMYLFFRVFNFNWKKLSEYLYLFMIPHIMEIFVIFLEKCREISKLSDLLKAIVSQIKS